MIASEVIAVLDLKPHPEGGFFREMFRDPTTTDDRRAASTAIYYLLREGERSHWHRIDAAEVWHWYAGAPLCLAIAQTEDHDPMVHMLGTDLGAGARPQVVVPAGAWQCAQSLGAWTLVGCTVAPGFEFSQFTLAAPEFNPGAESSRTASTK